MTEVAYIHGIGMEAAEMKQRAANVPKPRLVDYSRMTEGELNLFLLREQADILRSYYPDVPTYQAAFSILTDSLAVGIHGGSGIGAPVGVVQKALNPIFAAIRKAKKNTQPAGGLLINDLRPNVGGTLVDLLDCDKLHPIYSQSHFNSNNGYGQYQDYRDYVTDQNTARAKCKVENDWRELLNKHLEKIGHHPLYEFITNQQAKKLNSLSTGKPLIHRLGISQIATLSKISKTNIRAWQLNGIMRANAKNGSAPLTGVDTIETLIAKAQQGAQVNGAFLVALPAILKALAAALAAAAAFVTALKQKQPSAGYQFESNTKGWGSSDYAAGWEDFGGGGNDNEDVFSNENLPLLLAAGAAGLLLLSK